MDTFFERINMIFDGNEISDLGRNDTKFASYVVNGYETAKRELKQLQCNNVSAIIST